MFSGQPIIIDVEASGLGHGSYPIEVGFALADGETHCRLIKPEEDWQHWFEASFEEYAPESTLGIYMKEEMI
jgi:hypothetical protein